jgi:hypothetical protein
VTLNKVFAECLIRNTQQRSCCRCTVRRSLFAECHTRQDFAECFRGALDKEPDSNSDGPSSFSLPTCTTFLYLPHACSQRVVIEQEYICLGATAQAKHTAPDPAVIASRWSSSRSHRSVSGCSRLPIFSLSLFSAKPLAGNGNMLARLGPSPARLSTCSAMAMVVGSSPASGWPRSLAGTP